MNILITGGLLGLAVVAILGSILLGMDEKRAAQEPKDNVSGNLTPVTPPQQAQLPQQRKRVVPPPSIPATPILTQPTDKLPPVKKQESLAESTNLADFNRQVQEIASEVRALAQHAGELEQRLSHLGMLLEGHGPGRMQSPDTPPPGQFPFPESDTQIR